VVRGGRLRRWYLWQTLLEKSAGKVPLCGGKPALAQRKILISSQVVTSENVPDYQRLGLGCGQ
jgi:hypothetical protein